MAKCLIVSLSKYMKIKYIYIRVFFFLWTAATAAAVLRVGPSEQQLITVGPNWIFSFTRRGKILIFTAEKTGGEAQTKKNFSSSGKDGSQSHRRKARSCKSRSVSISIFITSAAEHLASGAAALRGGAAAPESSNLLHSSGSDSLHGQLGIVFFTYFFTFFFFNSSLLHQHVGNTLRNHVAKAAKAKKKKGGWLEKT